MFSQRFSPTTGKMEWVVEDEDYDMRNEIARCVTLRELSGLSSVLVPSELTWSGLLDLSDMELILNLYLFFSQVSVCRHASR